MKQVNENEFKQKVLEQKGLVFVDFYADWCGPCQMLKPVLEEVNEKYSEINIVKVNVDDNANLCGEYGIYSIPHVLIFKEGKLVDQFIGFRTAAQITELIEKLK